MEIRHHNLLSALAMHIVAVSFRVSGIAASFFPSQIRYLVFFC